jgi:ParB family chromosome partitioning protein
MSQNIAVELLKPNPWNRKCFQKDALSELTESIKATGIREPLVVRAIDGGFQIASGNRRWLAAQAAGLKEVPYEVQTLSDNEVQDMNLVTNIQREEIGALEKAAMIHARMQVGDLTQSQMAQRLGKSEQWLSNLLGLLQLPQAVQQNLAGASMGLYPMMAIASLPTPAYQEAVSKEVKEGKLKPEDVKHRVWQLHKGSKVAHTKRKNKTQPNSPPNEASAESPAIEADPLRDVWPVLKSAGYGGEAEYRGNFLWKVEISPRGINPSLLANEQLQTELLDAMAKTLMQMGQILAQFAQPPQPQSELATANAA